MHQDFWVLTHFASYTLFSHIYIVFFFLGGGGGGGGGGGASSSMILYLTNIYIHFVKNFRT